MDLKLTELLPSAGDCEKIDPNDKEAIFISKFALNTLNCSVKLSEREFEEASYLIRSLTDRTWEQINSGIFRDVPIRTRKVYAVSCFLQIVFLLHESVEKGQLEECYRILDNAILIGSTQGLYGKCDDFIKEVTRFLDERLGKLPEKHLPPIAPTEYNGNVRCDIDILDCPSVEQFTSAYFSPRKPVLLRNTINHWPALAKWRDPNYLLKIAGHRSVPIEIGSNYTTDDWSQEMIRFKDFLQRQFGDAESTLSTSSTEVQYLAQHELFDQIPALKEDIRIPDYCCTGTDEPAAIDIKAWLGPCGTVSPMHQDPKHNILCQVFGSKKVILASVDDSEFLYAHPAKMLENTSQIDAEKVDYEKFPLVRKARMYQLELQAGDALYIPPKWWHYLRSLSKSFSVSFWWE